MKIDPSDWTLEYIEELGRSSEHSWIDFKKSPALDPGGDWDKKRFEISKDISAFSVGGGYIAYGVDGKGKIEKAGGVSTNIKGAKQTSEWISQTFSTLVTPSLKVDVIPVPDETGEKAVYVVEITESLVAPHQALDNKYYGRLGDRSEPLSDVLVRAVMFRQRHATVRPIFTREPPGERLMIHTHFRNYGSIRARDFAFKVEYPEGFATGREDNIFEVVNPPYRTQNFRSFQNEARILHPEDELEMTSFFAGGQTIQPFSLEGERDLLFERPVRWTLWADDSPPASGEFTVKELLDRKRIEFSP